MSSLRQWIRRALRLTKPGALFHLGWNSCLVESGWFQSYRTSQAIDKSGRPIPWYTYGAIHFLEQRIRPEFRVFEYGCGNSTRWYAGRVREVVSVEHDERWAAVTGNDLHGNVTLVVKSQPEEYVDAIRTYGSFDIVVVDGVHRGGCGLAAAKALAEHGVIIWDNSNRPEFEEVLPTLRSAGFRELSFEGLAPILTEAQRTTILYRNENCLGL